MENTEERFATGISTIAPVLFNIYTNDQPVINYIRRFIYADDLCLATQARSFKTIEKCLTDALKTLTEYYRSWFLNTNPGKTHVCTFHLNNWAASRKFKIIWEGKELVNTPHPVYLSFFKEHVAKLRRKVSTPQQPSRQPCQLQLGSWPQHPQAVCACAVLFNSWILRCSMGELSPRLQGRCRAQQSLPHHYRHSESYLLARTVQTIRHLST